MHQPGSRSLQDLVRSFLLPRNSFPYLHHASIAKVLGIHAGAALIPRIVTTPFALFIATPQQQDRSWDSDPEPDGFLTLNEIERHIRWQRF